MLKFAAICPHPPIIIPSIGKDSLNEVGSTVSAMKKLGRIAKESCLETIVIVSPHGPYQAGFMSINEFDVLRGDFSGFGSDLSMTFQNDKDLGMSIKKTSDSKKIPAEIMADETMLDHGTMVPLYYLSRHIPDFKIVPLSFSELDYRKHFEFGKAIFEAISSSDKKIGFVASGDLSHRLTLSAPAGYSPSGRIFDDFVVGRLESSDNSELLRIDASLVEEAGECGLRSIIIALGVLSGIEYKFEKLSYEGPFGVGYLVGRFMMP